METPLRSFLRTETGSASVLAGATVAALVAYDIETLSKAVKLAVARAKISA